MPGLVRGLSTAECPVSLISSTTLDALGQINRARRVQELSGASVLGDGSQLPAKFVDVIDLISMESVKAENAMMADEEQVRNEIEFED